MHSCETCERPLARAGDDICDDCAQFGAGPHEAERAYASAHGGYRAGSGRKPILDGGIKRTFVLTPAHLAMIDAWAQRHMIDNRSAALRNLIETAVALPI